MNTPTQRPGANAGTSSRYWRGALWGTAAALWLLPLVAMRFTSQVAWTPSDFLVFGAMLAIAGGLCEFAVRIAGNTAFRAGVAVSAGAGFLIVWINLAVGVIGSERHPANLLFVGVLVVAVAGALVVRCRPAGLAHASLATAAAQAIAGGLALAHAAADTGTIVGLTAAFTALWCLSAWLFRRSARELAALTRD
jgi:hypothetical protein